MANAGGVYYVFQETRIWEGSNDNPDPTRTKRRIKAASEERARRKLPVPGLGRKWVLVEIQEGKKK